MAVFKVSPSVKKLLTVIVPLIAFWVILFVNHLRGNDVENLVRHVLCVLVLIAAFPLCGTNSRFACSLRSLRQDPRAACRIV